MEHAFYILIACGLVLAAFLVHRAYRKARDLFDITADKLTQKEQARLQSKVAVKQFFSALLALGCLMPLVRLDPVFALAQAPVNWYGMAAVLGAVLFAGRWLFKIDWIKLIFKDRLTGLTCLVLALAGFAAAFIAIPLISNPTQLFEAIKGLHGKAQKE